MENNKNDFTVKISYKEIREISKINENTENYLKETYPEAFTFYCNVCDSKYPCSAENWGIECEQEKKF